MKVSRFVLFAFCLALLGTQAHAGSNFRDAKSNCSANNCSAQTLRGTLQKTAENFTVEVWARANECLRLEVVGTSPYFDPAMTVIGPSLSDNRMWVDDDSGSGLNPLIKISPVPINAWYTVIVMEYAHNESAKDFTLKYGRYPGGNRNCDNPTYDSPPLVNSAPKS